MFSLLQDLAFNSVYPVFGRLRSATDAKMVPQLEPWAVRQLGIMPSIGSRDVACAEWSNIRLFEHFL